MRIRSVVILLLMGLGGVLQAQSRAEVLSDPAKAGGLMYVYDYKADPPTDRKSVV